MGSRADQQAKLPGPPQQTELAYLAGLLDRDGGFIASRSNTVGLRLTADRALRSWLLLRFGGVEHGRYWAQTQLATLRLLLPRLQPYLVVRGGQCQRMRELVEHIATRERYHGDAQWRARRERLRLAVTAAGAPRRR